MSDKELWRNNLLSLAKGFTRDINAYNHARDLRMDVLKFIEQESSFDANDGDADAVADHLLGRAAQD